MDDIEIYSDSSDLKLDTIRHIGKGSYGDVFVLSSNRGLVYKSFKQLNKYGYEDPLIPHDFIGEIACLTLINKNNTVKHANATIPYPKKIYVTKDTLGYIMDRYNDTLYNTIGMMSLSKHDIKDISFKIVLTLALAQDLNILHCDIKPQNIMLSKSSDGYNVHIIDWGFGIMKYSRNMTKHYRRIQTIWYRAPEQMARYNINNEAIDMWSLGVIIMEMIIGRNGLLAVNNDDKIKQLIQIVSMFGYSGNKKLDDAIMETVKIDKSFIDPRKLINIAEYTYDDYMTDFIEKCLTIDPDKRLTPIAALSHPYFEGYKVPSFTCDIMERIDKIKSLPNNYSIIEELNELYFSNYFCHVTFVDNICTKLSMTVHETSRAISIADSYLSENYVNYEFIDIFLLATINIVLNYYHGASSYIFTYGEVCSMCDFSSKCSRADDIFNTLTNMILEHLKMNTFFKTFLTYDLGITSLRTEQEDKYLTLSKKILYNIPIKKYSDRTIFDNLMHVTNDLCLYTEEKDDEWIKHYVSKTPKHEEVYDIIFSLK